MGDDGLWLLEHAGHESGLPTATEVLEPAQADVAADHVDMIEVGPDNMQNFVLLRDVARPESRSSSIVARRRRSTNG